MLTGGKTPAADGPKDTSDIGRLSRLSRSCWRRHSSLNGSLNTVIGRISSLASPRRGETLDVRSSAATTVAALGSRGGDGDAPGLAARRRGHARSEEHTSELQSLTNLVCRLLLEKKKKTNKQTREGDTQ